MNLEAFLDEPLSGGRRGFGDTFRRAVAALKAAGVDFAVAGSVAYSIQVVPTYTKDVDLLVDPGAARRAWDTLSKAGFRLTGDYILGKATDSKTGVEVDLMFGVGDPEESARVQARSRSLLRVRVPVITPEYMLWMYLRSPHGRHKDRALELLRRGDANVPWLRWALRAAGDAEELKLLKSYVGQARQPAEVWRGRKGPRS